MPYLNAVYDSNIRIAGTLECKTLNFIIRMAYSSCHYRMIPAANMQLAAGINKLYTYLLKKVP